jgi:hypothetical protein
MTNGWRKAYDLADDKDRIDATRRTTRSSSIFGLAPDVEDFGSQAWWQAIENGRIPRHAVSGVIIGLYMTGHGDWPEFEVDSAGIRTRWTRFGDQSLYQQGREARIEYVELKTKNVLLGKTHQRCVLKILINASTAEA